VLRKGFLFGALVALIVPSSVTAATTTRTLLPNVTYTREARVFRGGPLVTHVIVAPKPGGLYQLRPVLSNGFVQGRERLTTMQSRLSRGATLVGINADFFNLRTGRPTGVFYRDGVLSNQPHLKRSSLGIRRDGTLEIGRLSLHGAWWVDDLEHHPFGRLNRPGRAKFPTLYTPRWGGRTPRAPRAVDVVLTDFPSARVGRELTGAIGRLRRGGGSAIPPGGAVVQGRGFWGLKLEAEAQLGFRLTTLLNLRNLWPGVVNAVGGGPLIVQNGVPTLPTTEAFKRGQIYPRNPRAAVGQRADGKVVLLAVDGRASWSTGVRLTGLAREMIRHGAVRAMALDSGGSTTLAWNGRLLNRPPGGYERAVADGLMLFYYGVYVPQPARPVFSPNGDGVLDVQRVGFKLARRASVALSLRGPAGRVAYRTTITRARGVWSRAFRTRLADGTWSWVVRAVDAKGRRSGMARRFVVNRTLGFLRLSNDRIKVRKGRGGRLGIYFRLANRADVVVTVSRAGRVVKRIVRTGAAPGRLAFAWDGRNPRGGVVRTGWYTVRVRATNALGPIALSRSLFIRRIP
jgi:phosphodiester glycosidase/flagellar hook capping protein FlgD